MTKDKRLPVTRTPHYEPSDNDYTGFQSEHLAAEIFELGDASLTLWYEGPDMRTEDLSDDAHLSPTQRGLRDFAKVCRVAANWAEQHRKDWHRKQETKPRRLEINV